jgi:hypothetical protein
MSDSLTIEDICNEIKEANNDEYHRGQSWEYCYGFFRNYKKLRDDDNLLDQAALHLGFFLASWGMLRGSSFLLQANYKYYVPVIRVLIDPKYDDLWGANFLNTKERQKELELLFDLDKELRRVMRKENKKDKAPSDTLITKIIMATMGCVPAYDRYFKAGLVKYLKEKGEKRGPYFNKESFEKLLSFSTEDDVLSKIYKKSVPTVIKGIKYPPMKLLDLYFWRLGQ